MTSTNRKLSVRVVSLLLPLAPLLAVAACTDPPADPDGAGGLSGSGGLATGGTNAGKGGLGSGGASAGSSGKGSGGTSAGSGGSSGASAGSGGKGSGGTSAGSGGAGSGGASAGSGGKGSGGTSAGSGGDGTAGTSAGGSGGASAGSGGKGSGGASAGSTGSGGTGSGDPVFHIFMLMGQSNMAGVAPKQASDNNTDTRLKVWGGCNQPAGQWNTANPPLSDCPGEKGWNLSTSVDPGIWFGKTLLEALPEGDTIGLVGTAESGESINTFISGGSHHQMILNKIAAVKTAENARFAGVIFHQGESDSGQSAWPGKVVQLYDEVKAAFGANYDVPFILGELPAGGCCSGHNTLVHQAADMLPKGYWVSQMGTNVMDEYHFDHASVVLMGQRYGETMIEALGW
jgi:hypothetical protein